MPNQSSGQSSSSSRNTSGGRDYSVNLSETLSFGDSVSGKRTSSGGRGGARARALEAATLAAAQAARDRAAQRRAQRQGRGERQRAMRQAQAVKEQRTKPQKTREQFVSEDFDLIGEAEKKNPLYPILGGVKKPIESGLKDAALNVAAIGVAGKAVIEGKGTGEKEARAFVGKYQDPAYTPYSKDDIIRKGAETVGYSYVVGAGSIRTSVKVSEPLLGNTPKVKSGIPKADSQLRKVPSNVFAQDKASTFGKQTVRLGKSQVLTKSTIRKEKVSLGVSTRTITYVPLGRGAARFKDRGGSGGIPSGTRPSSKPTGDSGPSRQVLQTVQKTETKGSARYMKLGTGKGQLLKTKVKQFQSTKVKLGKGSQIKQVKKFKTPIAAVPPRSLNLAAPLPNGT